MQMRKILFSGQPYQSFTDAITSRTISKTICATDEYVIVPKWLPQIPN